MPHAIFINLSLETIFRDFCEGSPRTCELEMAPSRGKLAPAQRLRQHSHSPVLELRS